MAVGHHGGSSVEPEGLGAVARHHRKSVSQHLPQQLADFRTAFAALQAVSGDRGYQFLAANSGGDPRQTKTITITDALRRVESDELTVTVVEGTERERPRAVVGLSGEELRQRFEERLDFREEAA